MRQLIVLLSTLVACTLTHAAPPSDASIDALFEVTKAEKMIDGVSANLDGVMRQSLQAATKGQKLSAQQQRFLDEAPAKFQKIMREELSWAKMRPMYVQIYKESLTQEELDGMIAFYRTPAGVAMIEKMPVIMQKTMTVMQQRMPGLIEKMSAVTKEAVDASKTTR